MNCCKMCFSQLLRKTMLTIFTKQQKNLFNLLSHQEIIDESYITQIGLRCQRQEILDGCAFISESGCFSSQILMKHYYHVHKNRLQILLSTMHKNHFWDGTSGAATSVQNDQFQNDFSCGDYRRGLPFLTRVLRICCDQYETFHMLL